MKVWLTRSERKLIDQLGGVCEGRWWEDCDCMVVCLCGDLGKEPPWERIPVRYHMRVVNAFQKIVSGSR